MYHAQVKFNVDKMLATSNDYKVEVRSILSTLNLTCAYVHVSSLSNWIFYSYVHLNAWCEI